MFSRHVSGAGGHRVCVTGALPSAVSLSGEGDRTL